MKKLDIRKELSARKYKTTNRFYYWIYRTVMKIIGRKYHPHYEVIDDINKCDGPAFVIFNHLSRIDHMYVMEICYPRRINILAGYCEFFRSHLHWAFKMNNIIPKKQYSNDMISTKGILSIINQGGVVALAPEGLATNDGTPKPIVPHTGHLFKKVKVPVYFVELRGQYLQNTKVCLDERYGETYAKISLLFSKEDLEKMSVDEIDDKINNAFRHDEYEWQKEKHIKWDMRGRPCHKLDELLYYCPKCHKEFSMVSTDTEIKCNNCGNGATVDDYYAFHPLNDECVIPDTPSKWVDMERMKIIKDIRKDDKYSFTDHIKIGHLPNDHYVDKHFTSEIDGEGTIIIDHEGVHYHDDKKEEFNFDINYNQIYSTITELDSSSISFFVNGELVELYPTKKAGIYMNMLIEEMHRLHVNFYKNFKWNDYMYEGLDE